MHILKKHQLLAKIEYNYRIEKIQLNYLCKCNTKFLFLFMLVEDVCSHYFLQFFTSQPHIKLLDLYT